MEINYEYYKVFYYVAKYKSITGAAQALQNNQPNVTRIIKLLEGELGCQLMYRTNRGITLTEEGEKLFSHIEIACEQIKAGEEELRARTSLQQGNVTIGATDTALHLFLVEKLRQFHERYPGIRLKIYNYNNRQAVRAVQNALVDLAVATGPLNVRQPLKEICLEEFSDILVGSTEMDLPWQEGVSAAQLQQYPFVCLDKDTVTYDFYNALFMKHGAVLEPDIQVATADLILPMIENNLGIGFMPEKLAQSSLRTGKIRQIPLKEKLEKRQVSLIYDPVRGLNLPAAALKNELQR